MVMNKWKIAAIAAPVAVLLFVLVLFSTFNNIQKTSTQKETTLSMQYLDNQNELATFITKVKEQLQIADRKTDKLDQVLTDAISGRYDNGQPMATNGAMFSAMVEAYPQLGDVNIYDKVIDTVSAGREAFKNKQSKLLDQLRAYDSWRQSGIIHSWLTDIAGVPSNKLVARVGDTQVKGKAAEAQMYKIITNADTTQAFKTGEQKPLDLNPSTTVKP